MFASRAEDRNQVLAIGVLAQVLGGDWSDGTVWPCLRIYDEDVARPASL